MVQPFLNEAKHVELSIRVIQQILAQYNTQCKNNNEYACVAVIPHQKDQSWLYEVFSCICLVFMIAIASKLRRRPTKQCYY